MCWNGQLAPRQWFIINNTSSQVFFSVTGRAKLLLSHFELLRIIKLDLRTFSKSIARCCTREGFWSVAARREPLPSHLWDMDLGKHKYHAGDHYEK
ncbi:hypothetical protein Pan258_32540 [Symmachiella dynata]|nr:hypothetical protein Pan258_32540 [Symmachiella dynata]